MSKVPLAGQGGSASQTEGQQGQARLSKQAQGYVFLRRRTLRRSHQQRSGIEACSCGGWGGSGVGPSSVGFPAWLRSAAGEPRAGRQRWGWLRAETAATRLRNPSGPELGALLPAGLEVMRDPVSSQYSSFLFWRMPIPELDLSELEGLGLSDTSIYKIKDGSAGKMTGQATGEQEKNSEGDSLLEYSTFNFWRAPIASIHSFDLDLL